MKKLLILVSCFAVILVLSNVSFAQEDAAVGTATAGSHAPDCPQASLPFGYPPYPTVSGNPAYGIPYSYPRAPRRLGSRLTPPAIQPHQLPAFPTAQPEAPGVAPHGQPTVFYRPTPIRNFMTLISAPRPYIGYDPYAGYPPYPGYIPPQ